MQISYKLYPNVFENRDVQRCSDNRGSTVHAYLDYHVSLVSFVSIYLCVYLVGYAYIPIVVYVTIES